jgi:hypothetical protein
VPNRVPGQQASFGSRPEPVRESSPDTATVQVDNLAVGFAAGEDYPWAEGIAAWWVIRATSSSRSSE